MSQTKSGYKRLPGDLYSTPAWVTEALLPHLPRRIKTVWEPAAGHGDMAEVLRRVYRVRATDIRQGKDFLKARTVGEDAGGQRLQRRLEYRGIDMNSQAIITNPPYSHAQEFIEKALDLTFHSRGVVAMLLRIDYDSAKTRRHLFADETTFSKKIILTSRIRWIKNSKGSPSENHCWMIWDGMHQGPPTIGYNNDADDV